MNIYEPVYVTSSFKGLTWYYLKLYDVWPKDVCQEHARSLAGLIKELNESDTNSLILIAKDLNYNCTEVHQLARRN